MHGVLLILAGRSAIGFGIIHKLFALGIVSALFCGPLAATSIIVDVKPDRILILADSRAVDADQNTGVRRVHDDKCKILVLENKIGFAETGSEGYTRDTPLDTAPEFPGTSEAVAAYSAVPDHDLQHVAQQWGIQLADLFQSFYFHNPARVRSLVSPGGILILGIFAGADREGALKAYVVRVVIDDTLTAREGAPIPVGYAVDDCSKPEGRAGPFSTNAVTDELLQGETDRAATVERLWESRAREVPKSERELRRLEFVVERTGDYENTVGSPINAVKVTRESATWVDNYTCCENE